jgi:hypothetical protein
MRVLHHGRVPAGLSVRVEQHKMERVVGRLLLLLLLLLLKLLQGPVVTGALQAWMAVGKRHSRQAGRQADRQAGRFSPHYV